MKKLGKTAQFWITYIKAVGLIQSMQCAVKINDTAPYSFVLFEVTSIMPVTRHHNDVCWMPLYFLDLAN